MRPGIAELDQCCRLLEPLPGPIRNSVLKFLWSYHEWLNLVAQQDKEPPENGADDERP